MPTNFIVWNPSQSNQESDSSYNADTLRSGGATTDAIFPSATANKLFYQSSTFVAALAQSLSNKGFSILDSNYSNLVAALANVVTTADIQASIALVSYATSITFNLASAAAFDLTLTGNVSSSALSNVVAGQQRLFVISQDGTGSHAFAWPAAITNPGAVCSLPNSTSMQLFEVRAGGSIIYPITPMLWQTASGIVAQSAVQVTYPSTSGTVPSTAAELLEGVSAASGAVTRTLYNMTGLMGFKYGAAKVDSSTNGVTIAAAAGQFIAGAASITIFPQWNSFTLTADGVSNGNWLIT